MKKRFLAMVLALALAVACAVPAMAAAPKVKEVEVSRNGVVEVEFTSKKVRYKGAKVVVKDASGNKLATSIREKDNDDITFRVTGLEPGKTYSYTVSGVRVGNNGDYGKVKGTFRTPAQTPEIKKVKYDRSDKELEIEFATWVQFKNLKVTVKDASGKALSIKRIEKDSDELELKLSGMKKGKKYTVTISGVRVKGVGKYVSVTKEFTA